MHSAQLAVHLQGDVPEVAVLDYGTFYTVSIICEKFEVKYFVQSTQELINFKNILLWTFEKPLKM